MEECEININELQDLAYLARILRESCENLAQANDGRVSSALVL